MRKLTFILFGVLAGCGKGGLEDGTYTATFFLTRGTCPAPGCPALPTKSWTVSGGGTTLNGGTVAVALTPNAGQVGWVESSSQYDSANNCTLNGHVAGTLTPGPSPVMGQEQITLTGCMTCECDYQITLTKP